MEIERRFSEQGIQIPFPQRDIHIKSGSFEPGGSEPA
jgi:small-conductance mechanosensitive channel